MVPRLGSMSSNLWDPAAPCDEPNANILVPVHDAKQSVLYRSIKQTHKVVKKLFSYHFNMHLFRAKTFLCRPSSRTQTFRYRSIKQTKRSVTRSVKKYKKNYTPVDPKQFFHIHVVILAPDAGNFESISMGNSMNYKQHVFMYYCYLGGSMLV